MFMSEIDWYGQTREPIIPQFHAFYVSLNPFQSSANNQKQKGGHFAWRQAPA